MSLKNLYLPPMVIVDLYKDMLIEWKPEGLETVETEKGKFRWLGDNLKRITILVNQCDAAILTDKSYNFLVDILQACKLNMSDIALINLQQMPEKNYMAINHILDPEIVLLLGVEQEEIGLPIQFPFFQVQRFNNITYLSAPGLELLEQDKALKGRLWTSLKTIFSL